MNMMPSLGAILTLLLVLLIVGAFVAIMAAFATGRWSMRPKENRQESQPSTEPKPPEQKAGEEGAERERDSARAAEA